ncbi:MAG: PhzF family phenazine biosynthesis protein [Rhodospirillaceae bacterium]|nr:PhzF family phenazine biosynthesis protein [Rhodospirillaceae bacterium]
MQIPIYQIDAFTKAPFGGNPAAVCPLDEWLADDVLQAIALENNLSETAFFVSKGSGFRLRWFTPAIEVDLCGHATLATGHVILNHLMLMGREVQFETRSGTLQVRRDGDGLAMDFPGLPPGEEIEPPADLITAMGQAPKACMKIREMHGAPYLFLVYESEAQIASLAPKFDALGANVIATAPGDKVDFVSRFFAPMSGIDEDPVTGSAHCTLAPYWANQLDKDTLVARQISARGGDVGCRLDGDRVILSGHCAFYMEGQIEMPG